jgi:hypothetical protein
VKRIHDARLAIVAAGAVVPEATDRCEIPRHGGSGSIHVRAFPGDPRQRRELPATLGRRIDRFVALAYLALADCRRRTGPVAEEPDRIGMFVANTLAGWSYGEPQLAALVARGPRSVGTYQATAWFPAAAQGEATIAFGWRGRAKTFSGASGALGEAWWAAANALVSGAVDLAYVGTAESAVNSFVATAGGLNGAPDRPAEGAAFVAVRLAGDGPAALRLGWECGYVAEDAAWSPPLEYAAALADIVIKRVDLPARIVLGGGHVLAQSGGAE